MGGLLLLLMFLHTPQDVSPQESDPCHTYTELNDTWRANTNLDWSVVRCDRDVQWQGWYRMFYQGTSVGMPESCVPTKRCSTNAPLWLNGLHPRQEEGIVTREVCGSYGGNCCYLKPPSIQVKACPGNYTVYKLVDPLGCNLAYCTDVPTATIPAAVTTPAPTTPKPRTQFQQRLRLKMALQRELSHTEMAQFTSQIREKLIQMGYPSDITVKMV
ncbi:pancreatic secretory granule membrane major glycoprotein GP2-like isoform X2 [Clupea harengus]|uniref:Pancreatic secretory granule membrane major glycoprotein GP2-like isoform X2 n=1 Tax=Clupea harengus TaxID=7950 RepID=A0A6P8EQD7_CLUHA|nr:pancreatic secretory granule membrane major glycoprotein GP2-like isoform X2 [Clupea harengus]